MPATFGILLLGITAIAGTSLGIGWTMRVPGAPPERIVAAGLPRDVPVLGMVYDGLTPGGPGSVCAGAYQLAPQTCTHGPDRAPAGLDVRRRVDPVTGPAPGSAALLREPARVTPDADIVRDSGGRVPVPGAPALIPDAAAGDADFVVGPHGVACDGDGQAGRRVQALYAYERGAPSRYPDYAGSVRVWAAGVDRIVDTSAGDTGGSRHVRFVTTPGCAVDVTEVQLPAGTLGSFARSVDALRTLGYNRTDRKYLIFADATVYCGIGSYVGDDRRGFGNRNNGGPSYGRVDAGCWAPVPAARELAQMLGALRPDTRAGARGCAQRLDCDHDDFFDANPRPGSYLATHWNAASNEFLLRGDGGDDLPDGPGPAATTTTAPPPGTPAAAGTAATGAATGLRVTGRRAAGRPGGGPRSPDPDAVPPAGTYGVPLASGAVAAGTSLAATGDSTGPGARPVQAALEVREPTSTAVRLMWSAAGPGATYLVAVDGRPVGGTVATRARLIGLRPDTSYTITVEYARAGYRARSSARTAPAARPVPGSWFVLTNSLTGGAADLYAARADDGTPITLGDADGGTQEQWRLAPAGEGGFTLRSRATGRCVRPLGGILAAGEPLVQGDCAAPGVPRWVLRPSDHGCTLRTAGGDLALGVGAQRVGGDRVLTLQRPAAVRQQSWTALPG